MSISKEEERELEEIERIAKETSLDDLETERGYENFREKMREAARRKQQVTIRLDADIVAAFKKLAGSDGSYQTLINRALHDWLEARGVRGLLVGAIEEILSKKASDT